MSDELSDILSISRSETILETISGLLSGESGLGHNMNLLLNEEQDSYEGYKATSVSWYTLEHEINKNRENRMKQFEIILKNAKKELEVQK